VCTSTPSLSTIAVTSTVDIHCNFTHYLDRKSDRNDDIRLVIWRSNLSRQIQVALDLRTRPVSGGALALTFDGSVFRTLFVSLVS
jgi:hypothetical protein